MVGLAFLVVAPKEPEAFDGMSDQVAPRQPHCIDRRDHAALGRIVMTSPGTAL
jgi:hypothetical protein